MRHLTFTGSRAGQPICGAVRGHGEHSHAIYAPLEDPQFRAGCCSGCLAVWATSFDEDEQKPDWVTAILKTAQGAA